MAFDGAAPTACAATSRRRRRRSIINEAPPADLKMENSGSRFDDEEESHQVINPSRTMQGTVAMMTLGSTNEAVTTEKRNGDNVPFVPSLEVKS